MDSRGNDTTDIVGGDLTGKNVSAAEVLRFGKGGVVTARGTVDGLVIRLDGRVEQPSLRNALIEFVESRRTFLSGNEVILEWVGVLPDELFVDETIETLKLNHDVRVKSSRLWEKASERGTDKVTDRAADRVTDRITEKGGGYPIETAHDFTRVEEPSRRSFIDPEADVIPPSRSPSLFDGVKAMGVSARNVPIAATVGERGSMAVDEGLWDDANARVFYTTIRSGQKIETEHSLVIFGDVNSGAEIIAGGDIVVLGTLRGVAHAGAYDETGGGRVIFALNLQPTQLRIGLIISRGSAETRALSEIARVEGNVIVVESYQSRSIWSRKR